MNNHPSWKAISLIPTLEVRDLGDAVAYYEKLGFRELWRYPHSSEGSTDEASDVAGTHVGMELRGVRIMLALADHRASRTDRQNVYVIMKNIRDYHTQLRQRLGQAVPDLVQADYGMLDFALRDPWGHLLTFGEEC